MKSILGILMLVFAIVFGLRIVDHYVQSQKIFDDINDSYIIAMTFFFNILFPNFLAFLLLKPNQNMSELEARFLRIFFLCFLGCAYIYSFIGLFLGLPLFLFFNYQYLNGGFGIIYNNLEIIMCHIGILVIGLMGFLMLKHARRIKNNY